MQIHTNTMHKYIICTSTFFKGEMHRESSLLTTFITPFGTYCFKHLPFGIRIAPEIVQRKIHEILSDLEGGGLHWRCNCPWIDPACGRKFWKGQRELDWSWTKTNIASDNSSYTFPGHVGNERGVQPDPEKVKATADLPALTNVKEQKWALGMINYVGMYIPHLAIIGGPLYDLLKTSSAWT